MRTTAGHHLQPANPTAGSAAHAAAYLALHVDLESRFDEREEPGPHPGRYRPAEHRVQDRVDEKLPRGQRDVAVDDQNLVLEERPFMPRVGALVAIHPSR